MSFNASRPSMRSISLAADVAARSAKLFYYLTQSLAKVGERLEASQVLLEKASPECYWI